MEKKQAARQKSVATQPNPLVVVTDCEQDYTDLLIGFVNQSEGVQP